MLIGVPKEVKDHEDRVGLVPSSVRELTDRGHKVRIQANAGVGAGIDDSEYVRAGAEMIGDPDAYTAAVNALKLFTVDDVVISTLPNERSGWLRANLIERVQGTTSAPVEHVIVDVPTATAPSPA